MTPQEKLAKLLQSFNSEFVSSPPLFAALIREVMAWREYYDEFGGNCEVLSLRAATDKLLGDE